MYISVDSYQLASEIRSQLIWIHSVLKRGYRILKAVAQLVECQLVRIEGLLLQD